MSVKGAGNKSVAGDDNKSILSDSVNLLDLDYYSITEHINEKDLFSRIRNFSQGYLEPATLSILNSRINNSIASIPIIPSVTSTDRIEDVGHRVYLTIQELLRAVDAQLFPLIVALNFDYQSWIFECREARITFKSEYDSLKQIIDTPLDKPTTEVYDLRADIEIHDYTEKLHSESYRIKMDSRRQFLKAFDAWEASKKAQNDAVSQLRTLEQDVKKHTAVESALEAFLTADRLIVSNLQNAISSRYPALCPILKESITIPATREEITHPWDLKSLAGMAAIIYNQYHKPSFITFNNNLIKAMSFQISAEDTKTNPMKAVSGVQDLISTWDTHNLWAQMSPDHFWSAVLLRSLNSHALFRDVLQNTTRHLDAYQYSHILLPIFRIFNLIGPLTVAKLPLPRISRTTLVAQPTTSTRLSHCLLVLNKPLRQLPLLPQPNPPSAQLRPLHPVQLPPVQPLPRLETALIRALIQRVKPFTLVQSRLTKVLSTRATRSSLIPIVRPIIRTTVRSATSLFLTALTSVRSVSLRNPLLAQPLVQPITAVPALSSATNRPIACNFPPPGWQRMLPSADSRGCPVPLLLRMPFYFPACKN